MQRKDLYLTSILKLKLFSRVENGYSMKRKENNNNVIFFFSRFINILFHSKTIHRACYPILV